MKEQKTAYISEQALADSIRARIRKIRQDRGYSQEQIAQALGIARPTYTYYESGKTSISVFTLVNLAKWYGIPVLWFLEVPEQALQHG